MQEARRRRILSDMGIALWQLRAPEPPPAAAAPATAVIPPAAPDTPAEIDQAVEPWSVLSLAQGDTVLLVDGDSSRRDLRLALDVLSAASGDWQGKAVSRRFDWPPRVAGQHVPPADDGRRAFNAFVDKDLDDHEAALLLCVETLAGMLPDALAGRRRVVIPALAELGRDTAAKRALWRTIRESRR